MQKAGAVEWVVGAAVALFFAGFAALFLFELVLMMRNFDPSQQKLIASYASQQFVFFPTAGVFMLICFYPLTYKQIMNRVRQGPRGVLVVFVFLALIFGAGIGLSSVLDASGPKKSVTVWEVSRDAPDLGNGCTIDAGFKAHENYSNYVKPGRTSSLIAPEKAVNESAAGGGKATFCAVTGAETTVDACKAEQKKFRDCMTALFKAAPSEVSKNHRLVLTAESIFLLGMLFLGLRLAGQSQKLFGGGVVAGRPERLLLCGALLLALWPLLNTNYVASAAAIYGEDAPSTYRRMSPLFNVAYVAWAISVINFLQKRFSHRAEGLWRVVTVGATALGALQFDSIISLFRQYMGPGADTPEMIAFIVLYMTLCYQIAGIMLGKGEEKAEAEAQA